VTHQTIIVLDFGSQFTQLIARRLRELSVYSEILPFDTPLEELRRRAPVGVILSGGPKSVSEAGAPHCDFGVFAAGMPVLGICYGMQLMTHALGGEVGGRALGIRPKIAPPRSSDRYPSLRVWASHGDFVKAAPAGFAVTATSANAPVGYGGADRQLYAPVPSRSRAHRPRPRHPPALRVRRLRMYG
jgi:GMP synthase (glutamine-hydrolysing)